MTWMDSTPEQRERGRLPRFIMRPPKPHLLENADLRGLSPEGHRLREEIRWEWDHAWELDYDHNHRRIDLQRAGWEVHPIYPGRRIEPSTGHQDYEQTARERRAKIRAWADNWLAGAANPDLIWHDDVIAVHNEVASRLQEATADGFLLRALEATTGE